MRPLFEEPPHDLDSDWTRGVLSPFGNLPSNESKVIGVILKFKITRIQDLTMAWYGAAQPRVPQILVYLRRLRIS